VKLIGVNLLRAALVAAAILPLRLAEAQDTPAATTPLTTTTASQAYPQVTCTTSNALACDEILQIASDTRDQLAPLLQLGSKWRFPVNIHLVTADDPLFGKVRQEGVTAVAADGTMKIEAVLPYADPHAREFVQRQFVTALLWEKFFANAKSFDTGTRLDVVPLWLIEGLREELNEDPEHDRASIVRHATQTQRAPTLSEVTGWQELSDDRLLGLWQRAFCFYLVDSLIRNPTKREDFQQWLTTLSGANPTSAQYLFPTETGWQGELIAATGRSHDIVYTWEESLAELDTINVLAVPGDKPGKAHIGSLDNVTTFPRDSKLLTTLQQKNLDLINLELRAHPSWRPIIALYRFGLTAVLDGKKLDQAAKVLQEATRKRALEMNYHQKLIDYTNWFEVTKNFAGDTSYFHSYFATAQAIEKAQADPDHPNPIRAHLLQVESQL
jgi:hypothetical protein